MLKSEQLVAEPEEDLNSLVREVLSSQIVNYGDVLGIAKPQQISERLRRESDDLIREGILDEIIPTVGLRIPSQVYNEDAGLLIYTSLNSRLRDEVKKQAEGINISERAYIFILGIYATNRALHFFNRIRANDGLIEKL